MGQESGLPQSKQASPPNKRQSSADRKRGRIIESAERLFASQGFHQTTIAHISQDCGVHEASIFQYYKTKENLLVAIPEAHLSETLIGIDEHLQGMKGAEPKLRKLIWHQLRDLSQNRPYTAILLQELRTLPAFYESPAYELIRKYTGFASAAIREGITDGDVSPEVEPSLALAMIFGAIDSVVLRWLFFEQEYDPTEVADQLCALVMAAIGSRDPNADDQVSDNAPKGVIKRSMILRAASEVFGQKGYTGATMAEIAGKAGIAEATIYQYFKSKEQLLVSVPGNWFDELADELSLVFSGDSGPRERLMYLLRRWQLDFQTRKWETRVLILELYRNRAFYNSSSYKNTHRFWELVRSIVEEGRASGDFRSDCNTSYYLDLIQGTFEHEALARMMLPRRNPTVLDTEQVISLLIRAIETP